MSLCDMLLVSTAPCNHVPCTPSGHHGMQLRQHATLQILILTGPYSATVKLPVTEFSLRANSAEREPEIQSKLVDTPLHCNWLLPPSLSTASIQCYSEFWAENKVYEGLAQNNPGVGTRWMLPTGDGVLQAVCGDPALLLPLAGGLHPARWTSIRKR